MRRARRLVPIDLKMTADNKNSLYKVTENGITYYHLIRANSTQKRHAL